MRRMMLILLLASSAFAQQPDCAELREHVYRIRLGPRGFGAGFFLSKDGTFVTARHLFEESPHATRVTVGVDGVECPLERITASSRNLDVVIGRVRLGWVKVKVPSLGPAARAGDQVFGFRTLFGAYCSTGRVSSTAPEISITGEQFFAPGSSGSPVFNATGQVIGIALEMVNLTPEAAHPDWIYTALPIGKAMNIPKLRTPLSLEDFLSALRRAAI